MAIGSFIGVVLDRVPLGESVVTGRSKCRACGRQLNSVDLLPVAGYLVRRGRCASCGARIPGRYPLYEAAAGALLVASILVFGPWRGALAGLLILAASTVFGLLVELSARR